jgi:hypothetical protein
MSVRKFIAVLFLLLAWPAVAQPVNPTLWHVKGPRGDAWLLGSIHILEVAFAPDRHGDRQVRRLCL